MDCLSFSKERLRHLYIDLKLSCPEIERKFGLKKNTVRYSLIRLQIPRRTRGEAKHLLIGNHVKLSDKAISFLEGELLSDSHLTPGKYASKIVQGSKYRKYLEWLSRQFWEFGIQQAGKILRKIGEKAIYFQYCSRFYEELKPIRDRFYPGGSEKIVPHSTILDPLLVRQLYIGDGTLSIRSKGNSHRRPIVRLSTQGFSIESVEFLAQLFRNLGFLASRNPDTNIIGFGANSTAKFLDYIGPCPPEIEDIYGYKWEYVRKNENQLGLGNF
jgi:hypothetical protein